MVSSNRSCDCEWSSRWWQCVSTFPFRRVYVFAEEAIEEKNGHTRATIAGGMKLLTYLPYGTSIAFFAATTLLLATRVTGLLALVDFAMPPRLFLIKLEWRNGDLAFSGFSQSVPQYVCFATSPRKFNQITRLIHFWYVLYVALQPRHHHMEIHF